MILPGIETSDGSEEPRSRRPRRCVYAFSDRGWRLPIVLRIGSSSPIGRIGVALHVALADLARRGNLLRCNTVDQLDHVELVLHLLLALRAGEVDGLDRRVIPFADSRRMDV